MISVCSCCASATDKAVLPLAVGPQIQIKRFSMLFPRFLLIYTLEHLVKLIFGQTNGRRSAMRAGTHVVIAQHPLAQVLQLVIVVGLPALIAALHATV